MIKRVLKKESVNLYWPVYQNLEHEVILLANQVHFDDEQSTVYSSKIGELIIRCTVEIESISKELYFKNGGTKNDDNRLKFDFDCLKFLEDKWILSKKLVFLTSPYFHFQKKENRIIAPLLGASENPKSGKKSPWLVAYQKFKHNRVANLETGNISNLISAMAGLYLLNLYYKDSSFFLGGSMSDDFLDNFSSLFRVKVYYYQGLNADGTYKKTVEFDYSTYVIVYSESFKNLYINFCKERSRIAFNSHVFPLEDKSSEAERMEIRRKSSESPEVLEWAGRVAAEEMKFYLEKDRVFMAELNINQETFLTTRDAGPKIDPQV